MDNRFKYLLFLILTMIVFSCQNRPNEVLPRKKMENVMYDMYIAEALIENDYQKFDLPEKKEALIDQVLEKHKISEARWDTSLSWYSDNIDQYIQINDSVKSRLQRNQNISQQLKIQQDADNNKFEVKPADYIPPNFYLAGLGCDRGFKFSLDSVQLADRFADEDTLFFNFKVLGVFPHDFYSLKSMLLIQYADTTIYQSLKLEENKPYSSPFSKHIAQDTIHSLTGFLNLSGRFPPVPIQLYQISLAGIEKNDSSTQSVEDLSNEKLLQEPKMKTR